MKSFTVVFMTLLISLLSRSPQAFSQEVDDGVVVTGEDGKPDPNNKSTSENQPVISSDATAKEAQARTNETLKTALSVVQELDGVVYLAAPSNNSYTNGTKILFIRRRGPRLEPISQGQVIGEERNPKTKILTIKVQIDRDTISKYPQTGDRAVLLSNEMMPPVVDPKENNDNLQEAENKTKTKPLPGYLEFGMGILPSGTIETVPGSPSTADAARNSKNYRFKVTHLAYYSGVFPIGFEMDSHGGDFPTSDYQTKVFASNESVSMTTLNYRFRPLFGKLAFRLRYALLSDTFTTSAVDNALLSTKVSGSGVGARLDYEFSSPAWKPRSGEFFATLQNIQLEYTKLFSLTAEDTGIVKRGTTSLGSSGTYLGVEATALMWFQFIPVLKRWMIQAGYRTRSYDLSFQGVTTSEPGCIGCSIPQENNVKQKETDLRVFIGFRLDDPITMLFGDKDEKK